jgi:cell division transport system permease protein
MAQEDKRLKRRVRNSYFISTVSIAMVLFLLGSVTYLIINVLNLTDRLSESVTIHAMLSDDVTGMETVKLRRQIESQDVVREVVYISKEEAIKQFIAEGGEDFTSFIDFNPLPNSMDITLMARSEKSQVEDFVAALEAMHGVKEVVYQKNVIRQIAVNFNKLNLVLLLFGGALFVISIVLLANTIRMTIVAKRQIINTMKLVGANSRFIMRPFLGSAALHGLYAGLIATAMFVVMVVGMNENLPEVKLLAGSGMIVSIVVAMIVIGVAISLLFTLFAVNKAIKQTTGKAYL